jgi:hypothetical protein
MSRRQTTRIVRAVVAAAVVGAALAGCTVTVEGTPQAAPQIAPAPVSPAPRTTAPTPTRPNAPTTSDLSAEAGVFAEWVARGWVPRPILPVTDPESGASAWLFGTAQRQDMEAGRLYQSAGAPASIVNNFAVFPAPTGYEPDADRAAAAVARANNGRVVSSRPITVLGHRGLDVRIEFTDPQGRPVVDLARYVELPGHLVGIESLGLASDDRLLQQVQQIVADKLTLTAI